MHATDEYDHIYKIERPHEDLLKYYILSSLMLGPLFFIALIPLFFRYHTMHYRFDDRGVSMRWGILFRREINLTYTRIQDIHLTSNFVERWLGLARIQIQTASGSASAEMTIEGVKEFETLRNFLYAHMRGTQSKQSTQADASEQVSGPTATDNELAATLNEIATELRAIRQLMTPPQSAEAASGEEPTHG